MKDLGKYYTVLNGPKDVDRLYDVETESRYKIMSVSRRNSKGKILWYGGLAISSYDPNIDFDLTLLTQVTLDEYIELMKG